MTAVRRVPVGGHETVGQQPADLCGRLATKAIGRDRHGPVIERRDEQVTDTCALKSRRLCHSQQVNVTGSANNRPHS
jgi:hypothetical protein